MNTTKDKYLQYLQLHQDLESIFIKNQISAQDNRLQNQTKLTKTKGGIQISTKGHLYYDVNDCRIKSYHRELLDIKELVDDFKNRLECLGFEVYEGDT
jgi:hypothetical protein